MTKNLDRASLKTLIVNLLKSDDELCAEVLKDITSSNIQVDANQQLNKQQELNRIINEDFAEYEEVFKALA